MRLILRAARPLRLHRSSAKIFVATALGFPLLVVVIDLTDNLREVPRTGTCRGQTSRSATSTGCRESMFMVAAGGGAVRDGVLDRHLHAALRDHGGEGVGDQLLPPHRADHARRDARGGARLALGELVPITDARAQRAARGEQGPGAAPSATTSSIAAENGRVYKAQSLDVAAGALDNIADRAKGQRPGLPDGADLAATARSVRRQRRRWTLAQGRDARHPRQRADFGVQLRLAAATGA